MLREFHFFWADAWGDARRGMRVMLRRTEDGPILDAIVNGKPICLPILTNEDTFCASLTDCGVLQWNHHRYENSFMCDGDMWGLLVGIGQESSLSYGTNGYPVGFDRLLSLLHEYGAPLCSFESVQPDPWQRRYREMHISRYDDD